MKAKTALNSSASFLFVVTVVLGMVSAASPQNLDYGYYHHSCEDFEAIVSRKVTQWFHKDATFAASLIRLHFHDCAVRGCDASILLDYPGSERRADASKTLRGFEVIDDIKAELEKKCPRTVSCADILTAAARDATVLHKGPFWANQYGRKDGRESNAHETDVVPTGHENITHLIEFFQSKGLSLLDLVILSGAHTIGRSTCDTVQDRLQNYKESGQADQAIDPKYLNYLKRKCISASEYVDLDATTPNTFDNAYYTNLQKNMGLLYTDQLLQSDPRTLPLVTSFATQPSIFPYTFSVSMVRLSNILQDEDGDGEVRIQCHSINP
ncbi:hypothetical protein Nepgr_003232 [Nepenthes gracilis]|uniref:Peroxidase n=1 Tax=Nepenthes gracilis TaxID=150966 RepID=A0AAD3XD77_NEPGR|nr:hypothetical protein Nepgr_003232 [Nepenthes gracilis]